MKRSRKKDSVPSVASSVSVEIVIVLVVSSFWNSKIFLSSETKSSESVVLCVVLIYTLVAMSLSLMALPSTLALVTVKVTSDPSDAAVPVVLF